MQNKALVHGLCVYPSSVRYDDADAICLPVARQFYQYEKELSPFYEELITGRTIAVGDIDQAEAAKVISYINYLEHKDPTRQITLNIMSAGGSVHAGLAIIDAARASSCPIITIGYGVCASMGAMILACAAPKGSRYLMPHAEVLTHQLLSGVQGQQTDISIEAAHLVKMRKLLDNLLAEATNKTGAEIEQITERDTWFSAQEAVDFGLADHIVGEQEGDHDS